MGRNWRYWLRGSVKVEIEGHNIERFYNIAAQRGIEIRDIRMEDSAEKEKKIVTFWTTPSEFRKLKPVVRKTNGKVRIRERFGLPFFLHKNRGRKFLAAGVVCCFLFLYGMSFFIWDISFEGNLRFTDEMLLHYMEEIPVVYGMKKSDISCEELESAIRNRFTEITWVSAEIKGTRLVVRVKENEALLAAIETDDNPCDLIAAKDGVIVKKVVRSGISSLKAGDAVSAGDLLVDGTIPIYDDSETLVNSHEVHADAEIYAETVHTIQKTVPLTRLEKTRTGNIRYGVFLRAFDRTFYGLMPVYGDSQWEFLMEETQIKIFEDFYLPVYVGKVSAYEYVPYEKNYTEKEISSICDDFLQEYMEKLSEKGIQILGSDGKIEQGESGWQIRGTLTVIEDIAKETPIPEKHEEN